jgi:hypothetical protein
MAGPYNKLTGGVNLMGNTASVSMMPGEALMAQDVLYRHEGAWNKHWGWGRKPNDQLANRPLAVKGFAYKGKNNNPVANPARGGNFGIADDGAIFTKRTAQYSTAIALTEGECRYWNPVTETWAGPVALPGGVAIDPQPKPTILIINDNAYIVGWADANLRYDPVDRAFYGWGYAAVPANAGHTGLQAGGTLKANAVYRYRLAWVDLYTGEESGLSVVYEVTTTAANRTVLLDNFVAYAGARHFVDGGNLTNNDVGIVVYRAGPDDHAYFFLDVANPGLAAATVSDTGLAVDYSLKGDTRTFADVPRLNHFTEFRTQWYGISWDTNTSRVYYNDFRGENSFIERWEVRDYRELSLSGGEMLMGIGKTSRSLVAFSNIDAYELNVAHGASDVSISVRPMEWGVGCVAPKGWTYVDGFLYWMSDRGPYRWLAGAIRPQWIGKNLLPMFIDPESGLCQLSEGLRVESEVVYDQDARMVRFIFPCGSSDVLNRHIGYWADAEKYNEDAASGWAFFSPTPQCMDYTNALEPLVLGVPVTPEDKRPRLVFAEADGYVNEYDPNLRRGALPPGVPARGTALAGSGLNLIVTPGGLHTTDDGMDGTRLEVVHTDGTIDVRAIANNTGANIVPDAAFSQDPTGGTWYAGGIPCYWRSWVDHMGQPSSHKDLNQLYIGYLRQSAAADPPVLDVTVSAAHEWPAAATVTRTAQLDQYREKLLIAAVGRFFTYEIANSRPDETILVSYIETEEDLMDRRKL